jgi:hypothetical protein
MVPSGNFQTHNAHAFGSPSPAIVCLYCPRHFHSRGGRTRHMQAYHQAEFGVHEPNPSAPPSPIPYSSSHPPSPIPSNYMPPPSNYTPPPPSNYTPPPPSNYTPPPPSNYTLPPPSIYTPPPPSVYTPPPPSNYTPPPPFNYVLPPAEYALSPFSDYLPPPLHGGVEIPALNLDAEDELDAAPGMNDPQVPDASFITRVYHPKLDGKVDFFLGMHRH